MCIECDIFLNSAYTCDSPSDKRIRNYLISLGILTHKPLVKSILTLVAGTKLSNFIVNNMCISSFVEVVCEVIIYD